MWQSLIFRKIINQKCSLFWTNQDVTSYESYSAAKIKNQDPCRGKWAEPRSKNEEQKTEHPAAQINKESTDLLTLRKFRARDTTHKIFSKNRKNKTRICVTCGNDFENPENFEAQISIGFETISNPITTLMRGQRRIPQLTHRSCAELREEHKG